MNSAWVTNLKDQVRSVVSGESNAAPENNFLDEWGQSIRLTYKQRLYGFGISLVLCLFFLAIASLFVETIVSTAAPFVFLYTLGMICGIASTFFLIGPVQQFREIYKKDRIISTIVFVSAALLTLVVALVLNSGFLAIVFIVVQFCALVWYGLSYIPGARTIAAACFRSSVGSVAV